MTVFKGLVYLFAVIALITGTNDILSGLSSQQALGSTLSEDAFNDPALDNIFRFFSGLWFGTAILFILFVRDLERYRPAMMALFAVLFIGGIGRLLSIWQVGLTDHAVGLPITILGLVIELIVGPLMALWLMRWAPTKMEMGS